MHLDLGGRPLHTRALSVTLAQRADGRLDAQGVLLDLRKSGFVPCGGDLGTPGIVHHMLLDAVIDPAGAAGPVLAELAARQPNVAFEPSTLTGGESCRDPIGRLDALLGTPLDADFARRLSAALGGPLGCSHILTLAQLLGATVGWALGPGGAVAVDPARRPGERVFRRDLLVDGSRQAEGDLELLAQLTDVCFAQAPAVARPMDRLAGVLELRAWARVALPGVTLTELRAAQRQRGRDDLDRVDWVDRSPAAARAAGLSLFRGISGALLDRLSGDPADRPLLDAMLLFDPTFIQVCGALSDQWAAQAMAADSILAMGGMPDSCYMWRRAGALDRLRGPNDPFPSF
ncbi:MAG: DUF2889 domain-containing protein [Candidatus Binatia bacterium]